MASLLTKKELEAKVKELQDLLALMQDTSTVCIKCGSMYADRDADYRSCYCDYESDYWYGEDD